MTFTRGKAEAYSMRLIALKKECNVDNEAFMIAGGGWSAAIKESA